jgi:hypothetical protein
MSPKRKMSASAEMPMKMSFEGGCDQSMGNQVGLPLEEDEGQCWEITQFGSPSDDGPGSVDDVSEDEVEDEDEGDADGSGSEDEASGDEPVEEDEGDEDGSGSEDEVSGDGPEDEDEGDAD